MRRPGCMCTLRGADVFVSLAVKVILNYVGLQNDLFCEIALKMFVEMVGKLIGDLTYG